MPHPISHGGHKHKHDVCAVEEGIKEGKIDPDTLKPIKNSGNKNSIDSNDLQAQYHNPSGINSIEPNSPPKIEKKVSLRK